MTPKEAFQKLVDSIDVYDESLGLTKGELLEMGMQAWDVEDGKDLWLFPLSYYEHIPAGFPIVDIFFNKQVFQPHKSPKDPNYGLLAFGVLGKPKPG